MKLSTYAQKLGIKYKTAWLWYSQGKLRGYQTPTGTIIVTEFDTDGKNVLKKVATYARVSSHEMKENLERQSQRLRDYCAAKGYQISYEVKEIGSGLNDSRPKLLKILQNKEATTIVVEHKDRLTRFGANYIAALLKTQNRSLEIMNEANSDNEDLLNDLTSVIYSFCARMYGRRRAKNKAGLIKSTLEQID
jgi:putative resolvase